MCKNSHSSVSLPYLVLLDSNLLSYLVLLDLLIFFFHFSGFKMVFLKVPVVVQGLTNPTRNHEVAGLILALAQWVKDPALP